MLSSFSLKTAKKLFVSFFFAFLFLFCSSAKNYRDLPKIYDCFLYFNEEELLEIRFRELYDSIDYFVIVEANKTFRGTPKPYNFLAQAERFRPYQDKIRYVQIDMNKVSENPWKNEAFQRRQIKQGLWDCSSNDLILISDVDEIPRVESIQEAKKGLQAKFNSFYVFEQTLYRFFLNRYCFRETPWPGTIAVHYKYVEKGDIEKLRQRRHGYQWIKNAGWHFTSMGGFEMVKLKKHSYSHAEQSEDPTYNHPELLREHINYQTCKVPIDETYPIYVREHEEELQEKGFIDL